MNGDMLGPYRLGPGGEQEGIYTGDARVLAEAIPDESVDLVFTDPVYDRMEDYRWLAETAARVLKPGGNVVAFCANISSIAVANTLTAAGLSFCDWLIYREMARRRKRWDKRIIGLYELAPWFNKGAERNGGYVKNFAYVANGYIKAFEHHEWAKEPEGLHDWLKALSGEVTVDFFTGGGTVPAVCKMLGRRYLAFEIDPDTAERARQRVRNTQPAWPEMVEQLALLPQEGKA